MAYNVNKMTKLEALKALAERINSDFAKKSELTTISTGLAAAFKSGKVEGNTVSLYTDAGQSGAPAFSFDFPAELFLDQTKTQFVPAFAWDEAVYPGSTDPSLEGKPVMVLAVKGEDDSVSYSFLDMAALVDTYKAKTEGKDTSTTVEITGYEVEVKVNVSSQAGNILELKPDGLYVPTSKVAGGVEGNFAALDGEGRLVDSGKKPDDFSKVEASENTGAIKVDGQEIQVVEIATDEEAAEMLEKVFGTAV